MEYTVHIGEESLEKLTKILGGESGGGDGELKTAQVTLVTENAAKLATYPVIADSKYIIVGEGVPIGQTTATYTVPLYKDGTIISYSGAQATQSDIVSGSAEISDGAILVTGDCTIRSTTLGLD